MHDPRPPADQTEEVARWLRRVRANGMFLEHVPMAMRTHAVCLAAVCQEGKALQFVPDELRTEAICLAAVNCTVTAEAYVPYKMNVNSALFRDIYTTLSCALAVQKAPRDIYRMPSEYQTEALCLIAVKNDPLSVGSMPEEQMTPQVCAAAVDGNIHVLEYLPDAFIRSYIDDRLPTLDPNDIDRWTILQVALNRGWHDVAKTLVHSHGKIFVEIALPFLKGPQAAALAAIGREMELGELAASCHPAPSSRPRL